MKKTYEIKPVEQNLNLADKEQFVRLYTDDYEKSAISALISDLPALGIAESATSLYTLTFPEGLPHNLMQLNQGGYSTVLRNPETGKIAGTASISPVGGESVLLLGAFSALSFATGQYHLHQINSDLTMINQKIDKILEFLYGNKRAELLSEISFVRNAFMNYKSIMHHNEQRNATLIGLQSSKKVAIKDIEFYIYDLESAIEPDLKNMSPLEDIANKAFQIRDSINLSIQLFGTSSLLEAYYSQNSDPEYLKNVQSELDAYIHKCNSRILSSFSGLKQRISDHKDILPIPSKMDKAALLKEIDAIIHELTTESENTEQKRIHKALASLNARTELIVDKDGNIYYKKSE